MTTKFSKVMAYAIISPISQALWAAAWQNSGHYFPVFSPNTGKRRPEKTPYLDTFHARAWADAQKITLLLVKTSFIH